ncbi:MAG: prenyltransferase/squalene oxidase repeat-containing protein [Candidatus Bathyarchaeia archaeon]
MREIGRFHSRITEAASSVARKVIRYVGNRQNDDGGYAFVQGTDSNAKDTYYGLAILNRLGASFPNMERTIKWLCDFEPDSHYSHYYVAKALMLCGEKPHKTLKEFLLSQISKNKFGTVDVYVEIASEFQFLSMITELAKMIDGKIDYNKVAQWLLTFQNSDGGFGAHGYSSLNSTYHALAVLSNIDFDVKSLKKTVQYVRACEKPYGGFTIVPDSVNPYMEHVYYGTAALTLLGEKVRYPKQTIEFVLKCQNLNGGFARSDLGISTFEDTYSAISVLQIIEEGEA